MAQQTIGIGAVPNDGTGDALRTTGGKINANFSELYSGSHIYNATSKTTPVDADEVPIIDSAASNVLKKLTWANLKATLKTYFDTLYSPVTGAWTAWTPTVTSQSGTVTGATISTTAKYLKIGKTVYWKIQCTITNVGSGAPGNAVKFTTPAGLTPVDTYSPATAFYVNSALNAGGFMSGTGEAFAFKADGTTLWANGNVFVIGGVYEAA